MKRMAELFAPAGIVVDSTHHVVHEMPRYVYICVRCSKIYYFILSFRLFQLARYFDDNSVCQWFEHIAKSEGASSEALEKLLVICFQIFLV